MHSLIFAFIKKTSDQCHCNCVH